MTPEEWRAKIEDIVRQGGLWTEGRVRAAQNELEDVRRQVLDEMIRLSPDDGPYQMWNLQTILRAIDQSSRDLEADTLPILLLAATAAWQRAQTALRGLGIDFGPDLPQAGGLAEMIRNLVRNVSERLRIDLRGIVLRGIAAGTLSSVIMRQVRERLARAEVDIALGVRTSLASILSLSYWQHQQEAYERDPSLLKMWIGILDDRIRPAHIDAHFRYTTKPISFGEDFIVGGERCKYPHDPVLSVWNRANCRCIMWVLRKEMLNV